MKKVSDMNNLNDNQYYVGYRNRFGTMSKHMVVFYSKPNISKSQATFVFGMVVSYDSDTGLPQKINYLRYKNFPFFKQFSVVFELTEEELMNHVILENI